MSRRRPKSIALVGAALTLLVGCGSTVQMTGQVAADQPGLGSSAGSNIPGGQDATGTGPGRSTGVITPPSGTAVALGSTPAAAGQGLPSSSTNAGAAVSGAPVTAGPIPSKGKGWDAQYVDVGVITNQDISDFAQTIGVNSLDGGNQQKDAEAIIADLNAHGGLYGRKIRGLYYDVKTTTDRETSAQAACFYFTQDHPVIAVIVAAVENDTDSFRSCVRKSNTVTLAGGAQPFDDKVFNDLQGWYNQMSLASWNTFGPALIRQLQAQKYFTGWNTATGQAGPAAVKVGILTLDDPQSHRIVSLLQQQLSGLHLAPPDVFYANNQGDLQAAVLRFQADNVTHVLDTDQFLFAFMNNANSQHYRPRYGIGSPNAPGLLLQGTVPAQQLIGAVGLGYFPTLDVDAQHDPGTAIAGAASCRAALARHGVTYPDNKRFALLYEYVLCDAFNLITSAASEGGGLTGDDMRIGIGRAGGALRSASTFTSGLSPTVRAEPIAGRPLAYDAGCNCFRYTGPVTHF